MTLIANLRLFCPEFGAKSHLLKDTTWQLKNLCIAQLGIALVLLMQFDVSAAESESEGASTVEYYYTVKHGYLDEWMELYKKNHWPILEAEMEDGLILEVTVDRARTYLPESHRWSVRVTITFESALVPLGLVDRNRESNVARLFPDRKLFDDEERRRFQLLVGFMEVKVATVSTDDW